MRGDSVRHVMVIADNVDALGAQTFQHGLQLVLQHGEVAIYHGVVICASEGRPRVDAHFFRHRASAGHLHFTANHDLEHAVVRLAFRAKCSIDRCTGDRVLARSEGGAEDLARLRLCGANFLLLCERRFHARRDFVELNLRRRCA